MPGSSSFPTLAVRGKHSKRQIKRIFTQNPQQLRIWKRQGIDNPKEKSAAKVAVLPEPKYPPILPDPQVLPNGYNLPPPTDLVIPEYPFRVQRTEDKPKNAPGFLPVYAKFR